MFRIERLDFICKFVVLQCDAFSSVLAYWTRVHILYDGVLAESPFFYNFFQPSYYCLRYRN
jgi:hypothetical protein